MTAAIIGIFSVLAVFGFIFLFILILYKKGQTIHLWVPPIPCFSRLRTNRPMRIKYTSDVVQTLNPNLVKIFDETLEKLDKTESNKTLKKSWEKIKENPQNFTIWCLRFKKQWVVSGEKGKLVFVFSLFSPEEMIHRLYRKNLIKGVLLYPPLYVHHPIPKRAWIQQKIKESKDKGQTITPEVRRNIEKSYRYAMKEPWISLILRPTMLSVTDEASLVERSVGFDNIFKIATNAMRAMSTQIANFPIYKHAVENMREVKRQLYTVIHTIEDEKMADADEIQRLRHQLKQTTIPLRLNPEIEKFPTPPRIVKQEKGTVNDIRKEIRKWSTVDFIIAILFILSMFFTCIGAGATINNVSSWPILAIGILSDIAVVGLYMFKNRFKNLVEPEEKKPSELKPDDQ